MPFRYSPKNKAEALENRRVALKALELVLRFIDRAINYPNFQQTAFKVAKLATRQLINSVIGKGQTRYKKRTL